MKLAVDQEKLQLLKSRGLVADARVVENCTRSFVAKNALFAIGKDISGVNLIAVRRVRAKVRVTSIMMPSALHAAGKRIGGGL